MGVNQCPGSTKPLLTQTSGACSWLPPRHGRPAPRRRAPPLPAATARCAGPGCAPQPPSCRWGLARYRTAGASAHLWQETGQLTSVPQGGCMPNAGSSWGQRSASAAAAPPVCTISCSPAQHTTWPGCSGGSCPTSLCRSILAKQWSSNRNSSCVQPAVRSRERGHRSGGRLLYAACRPSWPACQPAGLHACHSSVSSPDALYLSVSIWSCAWKSASCA